MALREILLYILNGLLAVVYWLADHWPAWAALALADAAAWLFGSVAPEATLRRDGRTAARPVRRWHVPTLILGGGWWLAAYLTPAPVPYIGLAMWAGVLIAPACLPYGQRKAMHRLRWFVAVYAGLVLAFWILVRFPLSPAQAAAWSERLQAAGAGEALEWSIRAQFIPYVALLMWAVFPLTYFGYLAQQLSVQRRHLTSPWLTVAQRMAQVRDRGA